MNTLALQRTEISLKERIEDVLVAGKDGLTSMQEYVVYAVIQNSVKMNLATSVRMVTVMSVSMRRS